jgi:ATP-dependent DNA helicase DinG
MSWDEAELKFAEAFTGYESRPGQRALGLAAEKALSSGAHLIAQAPCGTGKSFVAQVSGVDHAFAEKAPVILATATKSLQDQYIRDCEALTKIYVDFKFALLKGRSNYVCVAKLEENPATEIDLELVRAAIREPEASGDLDRLGLALSSRDRGLLSTTSDECPGKKECPFGDVCLTERAKNKASEAQLVITNHSLLVLDAELKNMSEGSGLLPEYSGVIVDEAHELSEYATNILGGEITERSIANLAADVASFVDDDVLRLKTIASLDKFFAALASKLPPVQTRENTTLLTPDMIVDVEEFLIPMTRCFTEMSAAVKAKSIHGDDQAAQKRKRLAKRITSLKGKLLDVVTKDFAELVRWVERESKTDRAGNTYSYAALKYAPLSVAADLKAKIWDLVPAVLMSATVAIGGDFAFQQEQLGLLGSQTFDCESPFDFTTQARTYIPTDDLAKVGEMAELIKAADGRTLALFTSWKGLNEAYALVAPVVQQMGHRVLKQGQMPPRMLAQAFADDEHSVLFGVKSFMTGLDIQGDSLRLVIIDKLPFPVPSDVVFKARAELIDAQARNKWVDGAFPKLSIPMMALTLLQAHGRLIRSMDDRGLVAIMDSRMCPAKKDGKAIAKSYGMKIVKALPNAPILTSLPEAVSYLHSLEGASV